MHKHIVHAFYGMLAMAIKLTVCEVNICKRLRITLGTIRLIYIFKTVDLFAI